MEIRITINLMQHHISFNLSETPGLVGLIQNGEESPILKLTNVTCNGQEYRVIRYDKKQLTPELIPLYGLCRSLIIDTDGNVLSFAPPKSFPFESFKNAYDVNNVIAQEFVEGTMINLFWDNRTNQWEVSTRSTIGATSSFYKGGNIGKKTFRDMFMEAATNCKLNFEFLNNTMIYSFVLQHPENRIVVPFTSTQLYLVGVYNVAKNDANQIIVNSHNIYDYTDHLQNSYVILPEIYKSNSNSKSYEELISKYASTNTPYECVGIVFYNNATGERSKVRNPVYEQIRHLRGNQPKLQYHYLCLRKEGKVGDFLKFYPENKGEFSNFRNQIHSYTRELFQNYISCYIKKEKPLIEFSTQYRTHMFNIHKIYTTELKEKKQHVTHLVVVNYVNNVHPTLLMYCLNKGNQGVGNQRVGNQGSPTTPPTDAGMDAGMEAVTEAVTEALMDEH